MSRNGGGGGRRRPDPAGPPVAPASAGPDTPNRKERKEQARRQREALLRRQARRRTYRMVAAGTAVVVAVALIAVFTLGHRSTSASPKSGGGVLAGDQTGNYPWAVESTHLLQRLSQLGLPSQDGAVFHIHEHLVVTVEGHDVQVPQDIGLWADQSHFAPLHTHDSSGIIHVESPVKRTYTLGDFFGVWGVRFTPSCLGGYCASGASTLRVYVDGKLFNGDPTAIPLVNHEEIVVTFGTTAQLPSPIPSNYSTSLSPSCAPTC